MSPLGHHLMGPAPPPPVDFPLIKGVQPSASSPRAPTIARMAGAGLPCGLSLPDEPHFSNTCRTQRPAFSRVPDHMEPRTASNEVRWERGAPRAWPAGPGSPGPWYLHHRAPQSSSLHNPISCADTKI